MSKKLTICFTSDTHGYLYPTNYVDADEKRMGLMKLAPVFPHDGNTLILEGGDTIQGSPMTNDFNRLDTDSKQRTLTDSRYGGHPFAAMMNLAGYHYVTLGNHDFNTGVEGLAAYLGALDAQCLCCNIRDKRGELPIRPWAIHTLENGLRIGLVGACTDYVAKWENPATAAELEIREPVAAYIYANTSIVLDLTAAVLRQYMERSAAYFSPQSDGTVVVSDDFLLPKVQHDNYDFFSGVDYVMDLRRAPGQRIVSIRLNGRELTEDEHVSVCISSYRYNGTGGYEMLPGQPLLKDVQVDTADAIIDYIICHPEICVDKHQWYQVIR